MDVTIVVHDNIVLVDGEPRAVDCSGLDQNIRVVQWSGDAGKGWVEFFGDPHAPFRHNGLLAGPDDFAEYQSLVDTWQITQPLKEQIEERGRQIIEEHQRLMAEKMPPPPAQ